MHAPSQFWPQLFALGPLGPVTLAAAAAAALGQALWTVREAQRALRTDAFALQIRKLLAAGNLDRAVKLAHVHDGPACRLALAGLQARQLEQDPANFFSDALPALLREARSGLPLISGLTCLALLLSGLTAMQLFAAGLPLADLAPALGGLALLAVVSVRNALRWTGWARELDVIVAAVTER